MSTPTIPPRPTDRSPEVFEAACRAILPELMDWLKQGGDRRMTEGLVLSDMKRAGAYTHDAYAMAKAFEGLGWAPDAELVEILANFSTYSAEKEATRAWVSANGITVPFTAGQRARSDRFGAGLVREVRADVADVVFLPDSEADHPRFKLGGGYILHAENLAPEPAPRVLREFVTDEVSE